jgi:hypothetical protein
MIPKELEAQMQRLVRAQAATEESLAQFFVAQTKTEERLAELIATVDRALLSFGLVLGNHDARLDRLEGNPRS